MFFFLFSSHIWTSIILLLYKNIHSIFQKATTTIASVLEQLMILFGQYSLESRQRLVDLSRISEHSDEVGVTQMVLPALGAQSRRRRQKCTCTCTHACEMNGKQ